MEWSTDQTCKKLFKKETEITVSKKARRDKLGSHIKFSFTVRSNRKAGPKMREGPPLAS